MKGLFIKVYFTAYTLAVGYTLNNINWTTYVGLTVIGIVLYLTEVSNN